MRIAFIIYIETNTSGDNPRNNVLMRYKQRL